MSTTMTSDDTRAARTEAVRALEAEFGELINRFRRIITENANRVSPGMLPGAYKVFTTIVRREQVTLSALAEALLSDKGQISRTVRELEQLGLVQRTLTPTTAGRASSRRRRSAWSGSPRRAPRRRASSSMRSKSGPSTTSSTSPAFSTH